MKRIVRVGFSTVIAFLVAGATIAAADTVVKGDAKGWSDIMAAWRKLPTLKSYRLKITSGEMSGTMTVVAPDRLHVVMTVEGMTSESITVGQDMRFRHGNGPWNCGPAQDVTALLTPAAFDIGENTKPGVREEVTVTRGPAVTIDGVQTQSFTVSMKSPDENSTNRVYIGTASRLPKRFEILDETGKVRNTVTFLDVNMAITITAPACK